MISGVTHLSLQKKDKTSGRAEGNLIPPDKGKALTEKFSSLSGSRILNSIFELDDPGRMVRRLAEEDLYWLVKKLGEDDCLPILELASEKQWQYIMDLETWKKDRIDLASTSEWITRLYQADCPRLVKWFFSSGQPIAFYSLSKNLEVLIMDSEDDLHNMPEGFFTLDGVCYIRVMEPQYHDTFYNIIKEMAKTDFVKYQALIFGLAGVIPAESEESMYRIRNVRLAEHGFLPFEEALKVYSPLLPDALAVDEKGKIPGILIEEDGNAVVPRTHFYQGGEGTLLQQTVSEIADPILMDRVCLEFAGLCNKIISADGNMDQDLDILIRTCRKAAGYINIAMEKACKGDIGSAEKMVRDNSLEAFFRVGLGLVLKVKWEVVRWEKESWSRKESLSPEFWGEDWGGALKGILQKFPLFYSGIQEEEEFRDFKSILELTACMDALRKTMVLDSLFENLTQSYPVEDGLIKASDTTFRPLLFNLWARFVLHEELNFSGIPTGQAKRLFDFLRADEKAPPYNMPGFKDPFVDYFLSLASNPDPEAGAILKETLSEIWEEFREEYEWIPVKDLDSRYSNFITMIDLRSPSSN